MKSFNQYIKEKWIGDTTIKYTNKLHDTFPVFKNPTRREVQETMKASDYPGYRCFVNKYGKGDVIIWANNQLHTYAKNDVRDEMKYVPIESIHCEFYKDHYGEGKKNVFEVSIQKNRVKRCMDNMKKNTKLMSILPSNVIFAHDDTSKLFWK